MSNIEVALQNQAHSVPILQNVFPLEPIPRLADIDLQDKILNDEEYKKELKQLQIELGKLHNKLIGKGFRSLSHMKAGMQQEKAAISNELRRRLIQEVMRYNRLPARNRMKKQDIICGVWTRLPKSGHIAIFDRTWYGRVMVERLEGFCSENDWQRAIMKSMNSKKELKTGRCDY